MTHEELKSIEMWQERVQLLYDGEKCNGCALCVQACPKEALELNPIGASVKEDISEPPLKFDKDKCVLCGVCAAICIKKAFKTIINGEERLLIVENEGLPKEMEFEGKISVEQEKCPKLCDVCEVLCREDAIKITKEVEIDLDKCTYCGACALGCPSSAITLKRTKIVCKKDPETRIMKRLREKFLGEIKLENFDKDGEKEE